MTTEDRIREVAYRKPFTPFRVVLASGEQLCVERSFRTTVAGPLAVFAVQEDPETKIARKLRIVPLKDIRKIEVVSETSGT
jgi:hypothetical protein